MIPLPESAKAGELCLEALLRLRRKLARAARRLADRPDSCRISERELSRLLPIQKIAASLRERGLLLIAGLRDLERTAELFKQLFPHRVAELCAEAESILCHRVKLFGREFELSRQINWHCDYASRVSWPLVHYTRVPLLLGRGSDVRVVWELNRMHHLVRLGCAYALAGDERYAEEFLREIESWDQQNPPRFGVNWVVAMEAAIRAINLMAATSLFRRSPLLSDRALARLMRMLIEHARFIRANLECSHLITSNHYLSDLIGLLAIGVALPELRESAGWARFGQRQLIKQMRQQVLEDGVDYEGSTAYHRLALEIFALFFALSREAGFEFPEQARNLLRAMFNFARHYTKPDGTAPIIGDSDDGRLIKFKERPAIDHSYLMSLAAVIFEESSFKLWDQIDEEAIWWFGADGFEKFQRLGLNLGDPGSKGFERAQIFVQREGSLYAIIDCGDHGARGRGSHAHSDALSFEIAAFGQTFLRDPGTFVYTASRCRRNLFRSTAYHNTVRVDGRDISQIPPSHIFRLGPNVRPTVNRWESEPERDVLDAEHRAYGQVVHRRIVTFYKREGFWVVEDLFAGAGLHSFEFFFNFDAGLEVNLSGNRATARGRLAELALIPLGPLSARLVTRWVAPSYGTRRRASGIIYSLLASVPLRNVILIVPYRPGEEYKIEVALGIAS
jgi:hypothetical protein